MIEMRLEQITPELAREYLKKNSNNYRKLSKSKVYQYAGDMKNGLWETNGQPIVFDQNGVLKDGQHRLAAIIMANKTVDITIVTGINEDVNIFDVGMMRNSTQIARASGYDVNKITVAVANAFVSNFQNCSRADTVKYLKEHYPEINRAYRVCGATTSGKEKKHAKKMTTVLATYLALRLKLMPEYEIEVFFRVFNSGNVIGADGYEPSSALVARRMFDERYEKGASGRNNHRDQLEILMLALADFHAKKARQLNYRLTEPFKSVELMKKVQKEDGVE